MPTSLSPKIEKFLSTQTVRSQAKRMLDFALSGKTSFEVHLEKLEECADFVTETILKNYPDLNIPFHSRWGHFRAGGVNRILKLEKLLSSKPKDERVRSKIDLAVVSVLLDAGAGMPWRYHEKGTDCVLSKSEGLAVASLNLFLEGAFSSDLQNPLRCDAKGLRTLTLEHLAKGFQVTNDNPLLGLEGRHKLLQSLASALEKKEDFFLQDERIGNLLNWYNAQADLGNLPAEKILRGVQLSLGSIWPGRISLDGFNLGDVWRYEPFGDDLVPFHKLSQWLSYSLIEPLIESGLKITAADGLTGLAEYRNGGLFLDSGVLSLRDESLLSKTHSPDSPLIIEWRALTLELLERVADLVRKKLNLSKENFPLGKVLEGGTWAAGRKIASQKRSDGGPPLQIETDGTVF